MSQNVSHSSITPFAVSGVLRLFSKLAPHHFIKLTRNFSSQRLNEVEWRFCLHCDRGQAPPHWSLVVFKRSVFRNALLSHHDYFQRPQRRQGGVSSVIYTVTVGHCHQNHKKNTFTNLSFKREPFEIVEGKWWSVFECGCLCLSINPLSGDVAWRRDLAWGNVRRLVCWKEYGVYWNHQY